MTKTYHVVLKPLNLYQRNSIINFVKDIGGANLYTAYEGGLDFSADIHFKSQEEREVFLELATTAIPWISDYDYIVK